MTGMRNLSIHTATHGREALNCIFVCVRHR